MTQTQQNRAAQVAAPASIYAAIAETFPGLFDTLQAAREDDSMPGCFTLAWTDNGAGDPLVGVAWMTNYKAEEEFAARDLLSGLTGPNIRNFTLTTQARNQVAVIEDIDDTNGEAIALVLSVTPDTFSAEADRVARTSWGQSWGRWASFDRPASYPEEFKTRLTHAQGLPWDLSWKPVSQLRDMAKEVGVRPLPSRKQQLVEAIVSSPAFAESAQRPHTWPAVMDQWKTLVLRADHGPVALVLKRLAEAADAGRLGIGSGSGPFCTGVFLYDTADEHPELVAKRESDLDYYEAQMAKVSHVEAALKERGYTVYFLGNPCRINPRGRFEEPQDVFWLNAYHGRTSVAGYYTLDELTTAQFSRCD